MVGEFYELSNALPGLCRRHGFLLAQARVQFFLQGIHDRFLPSVCSLFGPARANNYVGVDDVGRRGASQEQAEGGGIRSVERDKVRCGWTGKSNVLVACFRAMKLDDG